MSGLPPLRHVDVDDLRIAYRRAGHGPPVLLLHGGVSDSREWERQYDALADAHTVVAWDAPGCGASSDPPAVFAISDYARAAVGLADALSLGRPHLVGLSFGGTVAIAVCELDPALARSLVLVSAYAGWAGSLSADEVAMRVRTIEHDLTLAPADFVAPWLPTLLTERASAETVESLERIMREFHPDGVRSMANAMATADLRHVLPTIAAPTLLLYGADDVRSPREVAEELHASIRGSTLVVLPEVGHQCNVEAAPRFNAELRAFLAGV